MIVLSDEFSREIASHLIPADLEAVKVLRHGSVGSIHLVVVSLFSGERKGKNSAVWAL